jgi:hypothetical protein
MLASSKVGISPRSYPFRWTARASAIILFATWLVYLVAEVLRLGIEPGAFNTYGQVASLAIVFVGYAVGWRRELAGGIAVIVGILAFFFIVLSTTEEIPQVTVLLFAVPGVLYLLAWHYDERRRLRL